MLEFISNEATLFPTPFWMVQIKCVDNESLKEYCYSIKNNSDGVERSNKGGWHSHPYEIVEPYPQAFIELVEDTTKFINQYCSKLTEIDNLSLGNFWFNINPKNSYNQPHDHQGALLSAVYYIQCEGDDPGNFEIYRGDSAEYFMSAASYGDRETPWFLFPNYIIKPLTNYLFILPSWVKHSVGMNNTDSDRISLAMNFASNVPPPVDG